MAFSHNDSCILIVDDNHYVLKILTKILQRAGWKVTPVKSGNSALKKLQDQSYDIAIIDVRLLDMNGLDLLKNIPNVASKMKKIILTGYPSDEDRITAFSHGADLYLSKPIKPEKLIEIVKKIIN